MGAYIHFFDFHLQTYADIGKYQDFWQQTCEYPHLNVVSNIFRGSPMLAIDNCEHCDIGRNNFRFRVTSQAHAINFKKLTENLKVLKSCG